MGKYQNVDCPICGEPLENGKVIVICPECGAPYHKDCVDKEGKCIFDELHAQKKAWEMPKKEVHYTSDEPKRCSRCGTLNPIDGLFCEVCGNPLNQPKQPPNSNQQTFTGGFQKPLNYMAYDPFTTPFGGVNPDEKIDEIPVKDWAVFIGQNTQYFIPKFNDMGQKRKNTTFNFAALLFNGFYFLYRKMYLWGIMLIVVMVGLQIPSILFTIQEMAKNMMMTDVIQIPFSMEALAHASNICSAARLVIMVLCGIFTNRLYKFHCENKIRKVQNQVTEHPEYMKTLTKTGGTSAKLIFILVTIYFILSTLSVFLLWFK